jgi:hypothetical protein
MKFVGPYRDIIFLPNKKISTIITWRELLGCRNNFNIEFNKFTVEYVSLAGWTYSLKNAKDQLDSWLIECGYEIVSQERFEKLQLLI